MAAARAVVLADDLIWGVRLVGHVRAAGGDPRHARDDRSFDAALEATTDAPWADVAIVDLTARAYDGVAAIRRARSAGLRVLAVGQHDDLSLRREALDAGAERVLAYRKLFEDGPATLSAWLG